jgi:multiple sugar transport system substrate-binding protein
MSAYNISRRAVLAGGAAAAAFGSRSALAATPVSYWHHFTPPEAKGLTRVASLFSEKNKDLNLAIESIPQSEYLTKVTAAVMAGSRPDSGMVTAFRFGDLTAMNALVDLTQNVSNWASKANFAPDAWEPATRDGRIYGVPSTAFVNWVYYRKDYFDEAGISSPPDTFDQFLDACIKLTNPAKNRYGFGMRGGAGGYFNLMDMLRAWGSPIVEGGKPAMDRAKAIEAVRFYSELYTKHKVTPPSTPNDGFRQIMEGFKTGQTAMLWHHTGSLTEIAPAVGEGKFLTTIRPKGPAARIAQVEYAYNGVMNDKNRDAAWKWVSYWAEPEAALAFLEETGYFPASQSVAQHPRITGNPLYKAATDTLKFGVQMPNFPGFDAWASQTAFPAFQKVLVGGSTVEAAVDTMMSGLEKTLKR